MPGMPDITEKYLRFRQEDPEKYTRFITKVLNKNQGIHAAVGFKKGGGSEVQSYLFEKDKWNTDEAKAWLKEHKAKYTAKELENFEIHDDDLSEKADMQAQLHEITDMEVFMTGEWHGVRYEDKDLQEMVENFEALKDRVGMPLMLETIDGKPVSDELGKMKLGHDDNQVILQKGGYPAAGWMSSLKKIGNKLYASFKQVPRVIKELVENKAYKFRSPEVWFDLKDGGTGRVYSKVLSAVALLGTELPEIKGLDDFVKLYSCSAGSSKYVFCADKDGKIFDFEKYTQKIKEEAVMEKELKDLKDQMVKMTADMEALKNENTTLKSSLAEKEKFASAAAKSARETEVKAFVETLKKDGKVLPAQETIVFKQLMEADASKKEKFSMDGKEVELTAFESMKNYYSAMPNLIKFAEQSQTGVSMEVKAEFTQNLRPGQVESEKGAQLNAEAKAIMAANKDISYKEALIQASKKHPELV